MSSNSERQPNTGEQDRLVLGLELVLTPSLFGFLGWLLDRAIGTVPVFTVAFAAFTLGYLVWKLVNGYDAQMAAHISRREPLRRGRLDG